MTGCCILFSEKLAKFYIGSTHDDVENRLQKHNLKTYGNQRLGLELPKNRKPFFISNI